MAQFYMNNYQQSWSIESTYNSNNLTNNEVPIVVALNRRKEDEHFIDNFINENAIVNDIKNNTIIKSKKLSISEIRFVVASMKKYNIKLKELTSVLDNKKNDLSQCEWIDNVKKCNEIKGEMIKLLATLDEAKKICNFNKLIDKRRKKRLREKKLRDKWKAVKIMNDERRSRLHTIADMWIRDKQAVIEREKQEENLRKDADIILSDIRAKRNDAKKCLNLLNELENLRRVKANNARARGEKLSAAADQSFENIIVQLREQWSMLDNEYSIEEKGLKLMLKNDNEMNIQMQTKSSFDDWEISIFGRKLPSVDSAQKNLNNIVMTRFAWDKYINYNGDGSRIPIGWIVPESSSSAAWQKLLKR